MADFAFLRLVNDFATAKQTRNPAIVEIPYKFPIQLLPTSFYLQRSNSATDIIINPDNFTSKLIDCSGAVLLDITAKTGINQFTDYNDIQQVAFEIDNLAVDYYNEPVFLKITDVASSISYYTNGFLLTAQNEADTVRLDYFGYGFDNNMMIDYEDSDYKQSIQIRGRFIDVDDMQNGKEYMPITNPYITSSAVQIYFKDKFLSEYLDIHTFRCLNMAFASGVKYINLERFTNRPFAKKEVMLGMTNFFKAEWTASPNYDEVFTPELQIIGVIPQTGEFDPDEFDNDEFLIQL